MSIHGKASKHKATQLWVIFVNVIIDYLLNRANYALSHEYFVEVSVQLEWQPRTRRVRGCHSNWTETSTKYEGDNAIVINTKKKIYGFV